MSRAAFFRDCKGNPNMTLTLVGGENYEWIKEKRPQNLRPRAIRKIQTNAVYLEGEENRGQGSYLEIPQASLMEYDGLTLNIYDYGIREMTAEEMKDWFKKCSTPWVDCCTEWIKGKKRGQGDNYDKILDKSIKGNLVLQYEVKVR